MKKRLWVAFAGVLSVSAACYAQNQLPPGTRMPDTPAPRNPVSAGQAQAASAAAGLDEAEDKIAQQDFAGAKPLVEKYLSLNPKSARALFDLGYLDQAVHSDAAAIEEYRQAIAADPKQFESRLALGLLLAREGKSDEARAQLQQAVLLAPSPPNPGAQAQAFRALAELDWASDPAAAKDALLSALKLTSETPHDLLLTAEIAAASGDSETAETAYRRLLVDHPDPSMASAATSGLVQLLLKQQKYSDAETLIKSALGSAPDDPALNAQLATALIAEHKSDEALPTLEKLRQLEPKNFDVDRMLADAYSQAGHPEKADPIYAEMALVRPGDQEVLAAQGRNLILEEHYPEAQKVLEQAVKLKPDDGDVWSGLAFSASQNKEYSTALQALSMRAKYQPETPATYFLRATSYDNLHQARSAEEYYRKFLAAAADKFPDQAWQARQRLAILDRSH